MRIPLAFLRRDLLIWSSYRLAALWQLIGVFALLAVSYFVVTAMGDRAQQYLPFVLSGIAFTDVFAQGLYAPSQAVSECQKTGTLEPMLLTPVGRVQLVASSALFRMTLGAGRMLVYLIVGAALFSLWQHANALSVALVFLPSQLAFFSIGLIAAGFTVLVKQGDPVLLVYAWVSGLLGGVLFPVEALPAFVRPFSVLVPQTHALSGLRAALAGAPPEAVVGPTLIMLGAAAVLMPVGIVTFAWAIRRAQQEGSLAQY